MRKTIIQSLSIIAAVAILSACGGGGSNNSASQQESVTSIQKQDIIAEDTIDIESYGLTKDFLDKYTNSGITDIGELVQSFPAPVEISAIIQDMKVPFNAGLLFDADQVDMFETSYKKTLGLGIYCADLGYLNVYSKTGDVINYLVAIRKLTEELKLAQFFDFAVLKRAATSNNIDSLLTLSTMSYWQMDEYLRANNRSHTSALLVTGVWTESLYLASQVYLNKCNKRMRDYIACQKLVLENLMTVLVHYMGNNRDYVKLVASLKELMKAYQPVSIENVENGDKVSQVITVADEDMIQVCKAVVDLRNKITEAM